MRDLVTEASTLGALLEETRGVIGVVLASTEGDVRLVVGAVRDSTRSASVAATLTGEFNHIGALLALGDVEVTSIKAASAARVVAQQSGAVLVVELDPGRRSASSSQAAQPALGAAAMANRATTAPIRCVGAADAADAAADAAPPLTALNRRCRPRRVPDAADTADAAAAAAPPSPRAAVAPGQFRRPSRSAPAAFAVTSRVCCPICSSSCATATAPACWCARAATGPAWCSCRAA
jgi:predicted regulator of Ras-like GTPase activity (Roadblock/LC7/MglB family)